MGLSPKPPSLLNARAGINRQHEVLPHMVVGCRARPEIVADRLQKLGLRFERHDNIRLMSKMAFGMFDTRKSHKCVPHHKKRPQLLVCSLDAILWAPVCAVLGWDISIKYLGVKRWLVTV